MPRPALFFDRDNTLLVSDGYLGDPARAVLIDGAAAALARGRAMGFAIVVFSNQSGVARGLFGEDAVRAVNARMEQLLRMQNPEAIVDRQEYCPYHPQGIVAAYCRESDLRKPQPGMILRAARAMDLDLPRSWVIGDAPRDVAAGRAAGCRTILFDDPALPRSPAASEPATAPPDYVAQSLAMAIEYVAAQKNVKT